MKHRNLVPLAALAALALTPSPLLAQKQDEATAAQYAALGTMFESVPLTAEQEARMPLAREIMWKVLPEGTMAEMMGSTFNGFLGPMMEAGGNDSGAALTAALGYAPTDLGLDEATTLAVLEIIDPAWRERNEATTAVTQASMQAMMGRMEPAIRNVMAELYAIYFTDAQLVELNGFFSTETGATYARQSYAMASDQRIMAALFADPEAMFGALDELPQQMEAALEGIAPQRGFAELGMAERSRLTELTGLSKEELEQGMAYAAEYGASE